MTVERRQAVLERVAELPDELLIEVERSLDEIIGWSHCLYRLNEQELAGVRAGLAAAESGDFVADEDVIGFLNRLGG